MTSLPVDNISGKKILDALFFRKVPLKAWPPQFLEASYTPDTHYNFPGQLTGRGYLQHIYLGEYMLDMYGKRLDLNIASVEEDEIEVFATPITRTQQSAAAFIAGMLNKILKKIPGAYFCVM
jgi:hypothetical protein